MDRLVCIKDDQVMTTSKAVADSFNREHKNVLSSVKSLIDSGHLGRLDFKLSSYVNKQNKSQPMYLLTERGFLIAMPFVGGSKSKDGQARLVDEFIRMKEALNQRQSVEWQQSRIKGKLQRRDETDAISEYLLPLARKQAPEGSYARKPNLAYINYTKLINSALGIKLSVRDDLTWQYLNAVEAMERMICVTIKQQVDIGVPYKTIYNECKVNAQTLVSLLCLDNKPMLADKLIKGKVDG